MSKNGGATELPPLEKIEQIWWGGPDSRKVGATFYASLPNKIASQTIPIVNDLANQMVNDAMRALSNIKPFVPLTEIMEGMLLRTEALNSSRIEGIPTNLRDLAGAISGKVGAAPASKATMQNLEALYLVIEKSRAEGGITLPIILEMHSSLMAGENFAGKIRRSQNWLGRSHNPIGAEYVPPPAEYLQDLLEDLILFMKRVDIHPVLKLSIAHAQFEMIHPFGDGNGRTGRALIQALLTSSGLPPVPISIGLFAVREEYYHSLSKYAEGFLSPIVELISRCIIEACAVIQNTGDDYRQLIEKWRQAANIGRRNSNLDKSLSWIMQNPAFTRRRLIEALDISSRSSSDVLKKLSSLGVISQSGNIKLKGGKRAEILWVAEAVFNLIEGFEAEIKSRMLNIR